MATCTLLLDQGEKEEDFGERIYIYRYRIYDVYAVDITTMVILTDKNPSWRPSMYQKEFLGTKITLEYPILKILDFHSRKKELEESDNPFALVILAQLTAIETKGKDEVRLVNKFALTKRLYLHKWKKEDIIHLLRFLDEILILKDVDESKYAKQVKQLEEEAKVSYMTRREKEWLEQGIEQGIQFGEGNLLKNQIKAKFNLKMIPETWVNKIEKGNEKSLSRWAINLLSARSLEDVFN